ncbi:hypothetical protein LX64_05013 [Chitinophaga skermanii]|uniref:SMI1/KNR4 family protein n=1 Tax=Chitinophaga skermanii TaxID=331697 RepID=A0A327Q051_9BACT|nr:hypothetical protein [Chitinophaga skermanii]RAI97709.1 hypothetical protein LX64_05013 [Chitinophaga skermanii]
MFKISSIEQIKHDLLSPPQAPRIFPGNTASHFDALYEEIVTQIKTTTISAECVLWDSVKAVNENKAYADAAYWEEGLLPSASTYWFFAENGQGDRWLFDADEEVLFYDHDGGELSPRNFRSMGIQFSQWLQFAYLNRALDVVYAERGTVDEVLNMAYKNKLREISLSLLENYPFED